MSETKIIRGGLVALHWGWLAVICNPGDPMDHYPGYAEFLRFGTCHEWILRSLIVALLATAGWWRRYFIFHEFTLGVQAVWLLWVSWCFCSILPPSTGAVAYAIFSSFALYALFHDAMTAHRDHASPERMRAS